MENKQSFTISATVTLFLVRLWETVMVVFFEKSFWWQTVKNDNLEHYQLGFLLLIIASLLSKKLNEKIRAVIYGVGVGLILDEIYTLISILFGLPYLFNGFLDWLLVLITYLAFISLITMKRKVLTHSLGVVGFTIFIIRVLTALAIYFFGKTDLWHSIYTDNWNHYYLGIVILLVVPFLRKRLGKIFVPLLSVGIALVLDEVTDVLKLLGFKLPINFRDSPQDLLLIFFSFLLFVCLARLIEIVFDQMVHGKDKKRSKEEITQNTIGQFNGWAPHYDSGMTHYFFDYCNKEIIKTLNLRGGIKILDVGCGTGSLLAEINKKRKGLRLYGVDLSPNMIHIAETKMAHFENVTFLAGNGSSLPFESDYFDIVICSNSLHHHPVPNKSLAEMARVLKRKGQLIIVDGFTDNILRAMMFWFVQLIQKEGSVKRFTKYEMYSFFERLEMVDIGQQEILYFNLLTNGVKK